jgi:signal transduction histidine kinase
MCYNSVMQSDSIEPVRVYRTGAWIWIGYLATMASLDMLIYATGPREPVIWYYLINAGPALVFMALSYSPWMAARPRGLAPVMVLLASLAPILLNHILDLRLPPAPLSNIEGMVLRQLPVLFIGLVLVAWRYNALAMLFYSAGTYALDLALMNLVVPHDWQRLNAFFYVATIRTISMIVAGVFVNQLIGLLRAQQEALSAANAHLMHHASALESLVVSRERNRLARELHDTLAHTLSGLAVQLETAKAYWGADPETTHALMVQSLATTRSGLDETRRALKALRASPLEDLGLRLALDELATGGAARAGLALSLALPPSTEFPPLCPDVEQCIYRIAQEAIENVVKHARAQTLIVQLAVQDASLSLTIKDDGRGFDERESERLAHYGLTGMRERATLAGGSLSVESSVGHGTSVQLALTGVAK